MPYVAYLNLEGMRNITDKALEYVGRLCPRLRTINITGCLSVSDDGVAQVRYAKKSPLSTSEEPYNP